jgi:hypothetical protein
MTDEDRAVGAALASYVTDMHASPELYDSVRRWCKRRRRARVVGSLTAVAAVAATVTVVVSNLPALAPITVAAPPTYTHPNGVRGSLGGNQELLNDATRAVMAQIKKVRKLSTPDSIRPFYAERTDNATAVLFTGTSKQHPGSSYGVQAIRVGTGAWTIGWSGRTASNPGQAAVDVEFAQRWSDNPLLMVNLTYGNASYLAIVVPPELTAELSRGRDVAADGTVGQAFQPLALHAGTALLNVGSTAPVAIQLKDRGHVISHGVRGSTGGGGSIVADDSVYPTTAQQTAAAALARGKADAGAVKEAASSLGMDAQPYAGVPMRFRVLWGGTLRGMHCVLVAVQFDSGALFPDLGCVHAGGGSESEAPGMVPAGSFDRRVLSWAGSNGVEIMAPPGAVRVEVEYADRTSQRAALDNGFAEVRPTRHAKATVVRVYDAGGQLLDQRPVNDGVHK